MTAPPGNGRYPETQKGPHTWATNEGTPRFGVPSLSIGPAARAYQSHFAFLLGAQRPLEQGRGLGLPFRPWGWVGSSVGNSAQCRWCGGAAVVPSPLTSTISDSTSVPVRTLRDFPAHRAVPADCSGIAANYTGKQWWDIGGQMAGILLTFHKFLCQTVRSLPQPPAGRHFLGFRYTARRSRDGSRNGRRPVRRQPGQLPPIV